MVQGLLMFYNLQKTVKISTTSQGLLMLYNLRPPPSTVPAIIRGVPPHWVNKPHQELAPAVFEVAGSFLPPTPPRAPPSQVDGLTSFQKKVWWVLLIEHEVLDPSWLPSSSLVGVLHPLLHLVLACYCRRSPSSSSP